MSYHARNLRRLCSWRDRLSFEGCRDDALWLTECRIRETASMLIGYFA